VVASCIVDESTGHVVEVRHLGFRVRRSDTFASDPEVRVLAVRLAALSDIRIRLVAPELGVH
jgi:hypothetical protein